MIRKLSLPELNSSNLLLIAPASSAHMEETAPHLTIEPLFPPSKNSSIIKDEDQNNDEKIAQTIENTDTIIVDNDSDTLIKPEILQTEKDSLVKQQGDNSAIGAGTLAPDHTISLKSQELERIKWQAFEEGKAVAAEEYAKKLEEHEKETAITDKAEQEIFNLLNIIKNKLEEVDQQLAVVFSKWSDQCLIISYKIACKVIEEVSKAIPVEIIANYLHKRLPLLREELILDVEINPQYIEAVETKIKAEGLDSIMRQGGQLRFIANQNLLPGDCTVRIEGGSFIKDQNQMLKEIEDVLQNYLVHSTIPKQN